ncbi:TPM domain-containing protein [Roseibacillus persicicus]|uniref:TPM domain-containing protein n=1 Tax=Roseibacillus persicicus TaxID=454148 RepID=UPI0016774E8F|nr:TPM domain-containing protein [Roseibacillus persicicus]
MTEDALSCQSCSLTIEGAASLLGPVPLLNRGLTDTTETLSGRERRALEGAMTRFEKIHPASRLNIVVRSFEPEYNLATHLFWLFNTAGLSPSESQQEKNQDILIGVDPHQQRVALMVGYGLEPFLKKEEIVELLETARPLLGQGKLAEALQVVIRGLHPLLQQASIQAHKALGLSGMASVAASPGTSF